MNPTQNAPETDNHTRGCKMCAHACINSSAADLNWTDILVYERHICVVFFFYLTRVIFVLYIWFVLWCMCNTLHGAHASNHTSYVLLVGCQVCVCDWVCLCACHLNTCEPFRYLIRLSLCCAAAYCIWHEIICVTSLNQACLQVVWTKFDSDCGSAAHL